MRKRTSCLTNTGCGGLSPSDCVYQVYWHAQSPVPGTAEGDRLDILATLVQAYETRHFPISSPDPIEAIKFRMEQGNLRIKDLEPMIGRSNRVYEVLNRKRPLTLTMIRKLHQGLGIPAEVLIGQ